MLGHQRAIGVERDPRHVLAVEHARDRLADAAETADHHMVLELGDVGFRAMLLRAPSTSSRSPMRRAMLARNGVTIMLSPATATAEVAISRIEQPLRRAQARSR